LTVNQQHLDRPLQVADGHEEPEAALSVSVVICTHAWRRLGQVLDCVASIQANSVLPRELVVVVDANPELREHLAGVLPDTVVLLDSDGNGVSEARNTGLAKVSADVVAFIDDDATADRDWLAELLRAFSTLPKAVGVGGRIVPAFEARGGWLPDELLWTVGCTYAGHPEQAQPIGRPIGCNMAFRREALQRAGAFSKDFGPSGSALKSHSNEEIVTALAVRRDHGEEAIWYWPAAVVHHFVPASRLSYRYLVERCLAEGRSKADVQRLHGAASMDYDRGYVVRTLLPAIGRYATRAVGARDAGAANKAFLASAGLLLTAAAYGARSLGARARALRP
jgi:glycosyltransferase involved in cell wall biosynthesis